MGNQSNKTMQLARKIITRSASLRPALLRAQPLVRRRTFSVKPNEEQATTHAAHKAKQPKMEGVPKDEKPSANPAKNGEIQAWKNNYMKGAMVLAGCALAFYFFTTGFFGPGQKQPNPPKREKPAVVVQAEKARGSN